MCGSIDGQIIEVDLRNIKYVLCNHDYVVFHIIAGSHLNCRTPLRTVMTSSEITSLQMADDRKCITGTGI